MLDITITSEEIFICDLRMGVSEDGLMLPIPNGTFNLVLDHEDDDCYVYHLRNHEKHNKVKLFSYLDTELSFVGLLDLKNIQVQYDSFEELYEHSDVCIDETVSEMEETGNHAQTFKVMLNDQSAIFCIHNENNTPVKINQLLGQKNSLLGYEFIVAKETDTIASAKKTSKELFCFELTFSGAIIEAYCSSNYDLESVIDTFCSEVRDLIDDDATRIKQIITDTEKLFDHATPIGEYCPLLKDLRELKVSISHDYYEDETFTEIYTKSLAMSPNNVFCINDFVEFVKKYIDLDEV